MVKIAPEFQDFVTGAEQSVIGECDLEGRSIEAEPLLNGAPYKIHRQSFDVAHRRAAGTFFTGSSNAMQIAQQLRESLPADGMVMDPTCGIGDLLLAYAKHLPLEANLNETLVAWGKRLSGFDLDVDLVRLTKTRLLLCARLRGGFTGKIESIDEIFPQIRVGDMLQAKRDLGKPDGFLFNPPFGVVKEVGKCSWSAGSANAAALFLAELIAQAKKTARISAILPEVLRCGSRYAAFRAHLEKQGYSAGYKSLGRFDAWADVDVFSTLIVPSANGKLWGGGVEARSHLCVGDKFNVHVGAVVPHRHPHKGAWHRYICAKTTPRWCYGFEPKSSRRFRGTVFKPPFVVVRRTSSPSDRKRAVATIIVGDRTVAVENHLLVLLPLDGELESCRRLLQVLASDKTNAYLNAGMRCRHLTSGIVGLIPWYQPND